MKRIACLMFAILIVIGGLSACSGDTGEQQTDYTWYPYQLPGYSDDLVYSVEEVVDMCYTPPNRYEVCYRTWMSNGVVVDRWTEVSEEEYKRIREDL